MVKICANSVKLIGYHCFALTTVFNTCIFFLNISTAYDSSTCLFTTTVHAGQPDPGQHRAETFDVIVSTFS